MTMYGYARVSTDGQSLASQDAQLHAAGCAKVFAEKVSGAKTDRAELAKALKRLSPGDVLMVTRLDRLARSTRDCSTHCRHRRGGCRLQISAGCMGRHHHGARPINAHGVGRPRRVRARADPRPNRGGSHPRQGPRRAFRPATQPDCAPAPGGR